MTEMEKEKINKLKFTADNIILEARKSLIDAIVEFINQHNGIIEFQNKGIKLEDEDELPYTYKILSVKNKYVAGVVDIHDSPTIDYLDPITETHYTCNIELFSIEELRRLINILISL